MSTNDFKRSTGYYVLHILRATGVSPSLKDLYVKLDVRGTIQRTRVIRVTSEHWNEQLPIRAPSMDTSLTFTLSRRLLVSPFTLEIGNRRTKLADLIEQKKENEEFGIEISGSKGASPQRLVVKFVYSDVRTNASAALDNLLPLVNGAGEVLSESRAVQKGSLLVDLVSQGEAILQDNAIRTAVPQMDTIVSAMDKITQAHPLLSVGWQLVAIAYKVASDQRKLDQRINNLLQSAAYAFSFAQDASLLSEDDNRLQSMHRTIIHLMDQIIESSTFIREIVRHSFLKRMWMQSTDTKKVNELEQGFSTLRENLKNGVDLQLGLFAKDVAHGFDARAAEKVLKEIRLSFGLTPIMLDEMESSNHQECMGGTRVEWIDKIIDWLLSESPEEIAFWVNGIPGSGKSTLAQTIARHLRIKDYLKSHIFFKRENTVRHNIIVLIAYRLAMSNATVAQGIASRLHKPRLGMRESFTNLILEPLLEAEKLGKLEEPVVIILDALDEYGSVDSRASFLQLLSDDFSKLPRRVRFLITSRPEADLVRGLSQHKHIHEAKLEINTDASRRDVQAYISEEMKKLVPAKVIKGPKWEEMMSKFAAAADGLFIWASLAIRLVKATRLPYNKIRELTNSEISLTLDDLYCEALKAAAISWDDPHERDFFAMLFILILPNRGFLTVDLFDLLLPFEGDTSEPFLFSLQSFVSGGRFKSVQIYHKTFADYLQSPNRNREEPWYIDMPHWNNIAASRCLLAMKELHFNMCGAVTGEGDGEIAVGEIQPHIIYASLYWADHLKDAEFSIDALNRLQDFLREDLLYWFEILSITKEFTRVAHSALSTAITWVSGHSTSTTSFLMDARSIVSRFAKSIAAGPMLIYTTALPLTSSSNQVSKQYRDLSTSAIKLGKAIADAGIGEEQFNMGTSTKVFQSDQISGPAISSTDMRYLISYGGKFVQIWNADSGEEIRRLEGPRDYVLSVAISLDGKTIASGYFNGEIWLCNTETGDLIGDPIEAHTGGVNCMAFSPNGKNVASGGYDCTVQVWSVESGQHIGTPLAGGNHEVHCITYSPDGKQLTFDSDDGSISVWDTKRSRPMKYSGRRSTIQAFSFSPTGHLLAYGSGRDIRIWDVMKGEEDGEPLRGHTDLVRAVSFSPDGKRIISGSDDGNVRTWSLETRREVMPSFQFGGMVWSVACSEDGSRILSASDCDFTIWNSLTGKSINTTNRFSSLRDNIAKDGSNLKLNDFQFFEDWRIENGWLRGGSGEYRLLLPGSMHKLVRQVNKGVYVHHGLHLNLCNAAVHGFKGFILPS